MPVLPDGRSGPARGSGLAALLGRVFAGLVAVAMLVAGFMLSLAVFAAGLVVAAVVFGWLWWKLRRAIRQARDDPRFQEFAARAEAGKPPSQGNVIEGEVLRGEWQDKKDRQDS